MREVASCVLTDVTRVQVRDLTANGDETVWLGVTVRVLLTDEGRTLKLILDSHPTKSADDVSEEIRSGWATFIEGLRRRPFLDGLA